MMLVEYTFHHELKHVFGMVDSTHQRTDTKIGDTLSGYSILKRNSSIVSRDPSDFGRIFFICARGKRHKKPGSHA